MAENSKIEWTHHTFNPWRGCTKVSDGCTNCYADTLSKRNPGTLGVWGKHGTRVIASESMWNQPVKWNAAAEKAGERHRVFCSSLADVFEGSDTMPDGSWDSISNARMRLARLIIATPHLIWLLLTKRPENVTLIINEIENDMDNVELDAFRTAWLDRVWIGTSVEDQKTADERIPELLKINAKVRFLSMEPLLGPVDLGRAHPCGYYCDPDEWGGGHHDHDFKTPQINTTIKWVIVGGESGPNARPLHPDWVRPIRDQCNAADVPYFFKQWGEWWPISQMPDEFTNYQPRQKENITVLQIDGQQYPRFYPGAMTCFKVGKKKAGRLLDGIEHNEFPEVSR